MRRVIRRLGIVAVALVTIASAMVVTAQPASAYTESCTINGSFWLPSRCTTGAVQAHPAHWIDYHIDAHFGCEVEYWIQDVRNHAIIYYGRGNDAHGSLFGVFSWYQLTVHALGGCGGYFSLENDSP